MTLEEAVAAYSLAFGQAIWIDRWSDGEKAFVMDLLAQLKGQYYALNAGDILSCARDPSKIAEYSSMLLDRVRTDHGEVIGPPLGEHWPELSKNKLREFAPDIGPKHHAVIVSEFTLEGRKRNAD